MALYKSGLFARFYAENGFYPFRRTVGKYYITGEKEVRSALAEIRKLKE